jgi:hypothetical protein
VRGDANPSLSDLPCWRSSRPRGMIARSDAIEQLAAGSLAARRINAADEPATGRRRPAIRLAAALAAWEIQAHRTLAMGSLLGCHFR